MRLLPVIFLTALVTAGQTPAPAGASVQGSVQSSSGGPVARAAVTLAGQSATADEQGRFKIDGIPPGRDYQLTAQSRGYVKGAYGARRMGGQGTPLTLAAGDAIENLTIVLMPQGVVTGRVVDAAGDPVQGAPVSLMRSTFAGGSRQLEPVRNATTDDRGQYRIAEVVPGTYYLRVTDRRSGSRLQPDIPSSGSGLITYYPSAGDPLTAVAFEVFAGMERSGIDVQLRAPRTYAIRGKAVDVATGEPVASVDVSLIRMESGPIRSVNRELTRTQSNGAFEFTGLEPGPHAIQVLTRFGGPDITALKNVLITKSDEEDVVLEVRPGAVITGTIYLDEGDVRSLIPPGSPDGSGLVSGSREQFALLVDAHLSAIRASQQGQKVNYRPSVELGNIDPALGSTGLGILQEDGAFQIARIGAGRYYMSVEMLPLGYFVKSATFNGTDALQTPLDLLQRGGELHIVLSNKSAEVTGALRDKDGKSLPGIQVTLWPKTALLGMRDFGIRKAVTDQNGAFQFRAVPPGEYYLAGWEDVEAGLLTSPEFLDLFRSDAVTVKLAENDRTQVDAKMIPSGDITAETGRLP